MTRAAAADEPVTHTTTIEGCPHVTVVLTRARSGWNAEVGRFGSYKLTPEGHLRRGKKILTWRVVAPAGVTF